MTSSNCAGFFATFGLVHQVIFYLLLTSIMNYNTLRQTIIRFCSDLVVPR